MHLIRHATMELLSQKGWRRKERGLILDGNKVDTYGEWDLDEDDTARSIKHEYNF